MPAKYSPEWLAALPPQFTTPQRHASITASEPPVSRESLPLKSARPPVSSPATTDPEVKKTPQGPPTSPTRRQKGVALASQIAASVGKMTVQPKLHPPTQSAATSGRAVKLSSPEAHTQIALRYYSRFLFPLYDCHSLKQQLKLTEGAHTCKACHLGRRT